MSEKGWSTVAGHETCDHYANDGETCLRCGAVRQGGGWSGQHDDPSQHDEQQQLSPPEVTLPANGMVFQLGWRSMLVPLLNLRQDGGTREHREGAQHELWKMALLADALVDVGKILYADGETTEWDSSTADAIAKVVQKANQEIKRVAAETPSF